MKKILNSILGYILLLLIIVLWPVSRIESELRKLLAKNESTRKILKRLDSKVFKEGEIKYDEKTGEVLYDLYSTLPVKRLMRKIGFIN